MTKNTAYQREYAAFLIKLRQARKEAGLTQQDVTKRIGRARTFISKVELGERRIDVIETKHLMRLYGKDLTYFD
jgi:transcriptional regulator with XRE-family HTH domain